MIEKTFFLIMIIFMEGLSWVSISGIPLYMYPLFFLIFFYYNKLISLTVKIPRRLFIFISILLLFIFIQLILIFISDKDVDVWGLWLVNFVTGVILTIISFLFFREVERMKAVIIVMCSVQFISLVLGIAQAFFGVMYFHEAQYVGKFSPAGLSAMNFGFTAPFFPLAAFFLVYLTYGDIYFPPPKKEYHLLFKMSGLISVPALIISGSRSSQLGFLVALLLAFIWRGGFFKSIKVIFFSLKGWLIILIILMLAFVWIEVKPISTQGELDYNNYARFILWDTTYTAFQNSPFFGIGGGEIKTFMQSYFSENDRVVERVPHNIFLQMLAETGLFGFILFFGSFFFLIKKIIRSINFWNLEPKQTFFARVVIIYMVIFMVHSLFHNTLNTNMIWIIAGFGISIITLEKGKIR